MSMNVRTRPEGRGEREGGGEQLRELVREPVVSLISGLVADHLDDEREDRDGQDERRKQQVELRDRPDGHAAPDDRKGACIDLRVGRCLGLGLRVGRSRRPVPPRAALRRRSRQEPGKAPVLAAHQLRRHPARPPANITRPATGPRMNSSLRFITPFIRRSSRCSVTCGARPWPRACQPLALELSHVGDDRPPVRRRDRPAYAGISPIPFVMTSKICPSGYFRIFSSWKEAVGTLPRWNRIPLPSPERRGKAGNRSHTAGGRARRSASSTVTGIVATNCPSAPLPVKKAASSFSPPIATVPGTGWRMDAPS